MIYIQTSHLRFKRCKDLNVRWNTFWVSLFWSSISFNFLAGTDFPSFFSKVSLITLSKSSWTNCRVNESLAKTSARAWENDWKIAKWKQQMACKFLLLYLWAHLLSSYTDHYSPDHFSSLSPSKNTLSNSPFALEFVQVKDRRSASVTRHASSCNAL